MMFLVVRVVRLMNNFTFREKQTIPITITIHKKSFFKKNRLEEISLSLLPPTKRMVMRFENITELLERNDFNLVYEILAEVLSNNLESIIINHKNLNTLDTFQAYKIIEIYLKFIQGISSDPN